MTPKVITQRSKALFCGIGVFDGSVERAAQKNKNPNVFGPGFRLDSVLLKNQALMRFFARERTIAAVRTPKPKTISAVLPGSGTATLPENEVL